MTPLTPDLSSKKELSESLFYMWRCVIAIAWADGTVQEQERAYLVNVIANLDRVYGLTDDQKKIFDEDLKTAQKLSDLLPHVRQLEDRASVIYFGDVLAWADGDFTVDEEDVLKKLHDDQMSKIDVDKLRAEIGTDLSKRRDQRAQEMKSLHADEQAKHPVFAALDRLLLRFGIDILD